MKRHFTLLMVDDDPDDTELFFDAVKEIDCDCRCLSAYNGEEALKLLRAKDAVLPDFIFLDLNMPRMNGRQFFIELKRDNELGHIPVIIYSTSNRIEDTKEWEYLGAAAFITKPKTFAEICEAISSVLTGKLMMAQ